VTVETIEPSIAEGETARARLADETYAGWWGWVRWSLELVALLGIAGFLIFDRARLFQEFLIKYIDEDQGIQWYAAREFLRGHLWEPCFFGQSYNSNIEGILAAPLVAMGIPYLYAVPLVTVVLGVLPFVLMGWVSWRRRQPVVAAISLLLPVAFSTRYGVITGMPRGFVTGDAFAMVAAILFLPPMVKGGGEEGERQDAKTPRLQDFEAGVGLSRESATELVPSTQIKMLRVLLAPWRLGVLAFWSIFNYLSWRGAATRARRSYPKLRYFFAAFTAVVALMFNPNCAVLLAAVAVYGILTTFWEWRFWVFTVLGLVAAAPYPLLVYEFYFEWHKDYRLYQVIPPKNFDWSWANYHAFVRSLTDLAFHDVVPEPVYRAAQAAVKWLRVHDPQVFTLWMLRNPAPMALMAAFGVVAILLLMRVRIAAILGAVAATALVLISFAYSRIHDGRTAASFPYSRMFLAVPILWVWLLMLVNSPRVKAPLQERWRWWRWWMWAKRWVVGPAAIGVMFVCVYWAGSMAMSKNRVLVDEITEITGNAQVARPVPVEELMHMAKEIQGVADREHVSLVVINGYDGRKWDYTLPEVTTCETLFPSYERRTWRLKEECYPRYEKILVMGNIPMRRNARYPMKIVGRDPPLALFEMKGQSVDGFCREMGVWPREFERPEVPMAAAPAKLAATRP